MQFRSLQIQVQRLYKKRVLLTQEDTTVNYLTGHGRWHRERELFNFVFASIFNIDGDNYIFGFFFMLITYLSSSELSNSLTT